MSSNLRMPTIEKIAVEEVNFSIFLSAWLDQYGTDLVIQSVGTATVNQSGLTISNEAVNASPTVSRKKGTTHPAGEVITYTASGGTSGSTYLVTFPFTTTDGQSLAVIQPIRVI